MSEPKDSTSESSTLTTSKNVTPQSELCNTPSSFGNYLVKLSDSMNENLIIARYTTIATVGILAAYGLAHTPLFFRYRTVAELPASYFIRRRTIHCRLVKQVASSNNNAILCQVRHLSPMERILSKSWFDWLMRVHPAAAVLGGRRDESPRELLTVQIAAVVVPEFTGQWWEQLVRQRTPVSCQLMARQIVSKKNGGGHNSTRTKRKLDFKELNLHESLSHTDNNSNEEEEDQIAIVKLFYRPKLLQLFPVDIGESMVRQGRASPCADGLYPVTAGRSIRDASSFIRDLRKDSAYMDRIAKAELEAAKASYGMWSDPRIRETLRDVVEEAEFQVKAPWWKKLVRWVRGG